MTTLSVPLHARARNLSDPGTPWWRPQARTVAMALATTAAMLLVAAAFALVLSFAPAAQSALVKTPVPIGSRASVPGGSATVLDARGVDSTSYALPPGEHALQVRLALRLDGSGGPVDTRRLVLTGEGLARGVRPWRSSPAVVHPTKGVVSEVVLMYAVPDGAGDLRLALPGGSAVSLP